MKKKLALIMAMMLIPASLMGCGQNSAEPAEPTAAYRFLDEDLGVESYAIGFRVGDEELAETVSGAVEALVLNGTYDKIGEKYPDIKDYLCLKADDIDASTIPAEGSGDPSFVFKHGFDLDYPPYSYRQDDATVGTRPSVVLTLSSARQCATILAGAMSRSRSTGMPRIWN